MKKTIVILIVLVVAVSAAFFVPLILAFGSPEFGQSPTTGYLAVIRISGTISYEESPLTLFGGTTVTPQQVSEVVERVEKDPNAKAVLIVINSPGGSAAASEEIYTIVKRLADKKPVVSYIGEFGTSGGYYIALPSDRIIASPTALTGSVGAVAVLINIANLTENLGIKAYVFKSGDMKDIGNSFRRPTDEELKVMQSLIDSVAETFIQRVREERGDKITEWGRILSARPFTGKQALELGLVDDVGSFEDAKRTALSIAELPPEAPVRNIEPRKPGLLDILFGGLSNLLPRRYEGMHLSYEILTMWPLPSVDNYITLASRIK